MLRKTERVISGSILKAVFEILKNGLSSLDLDRQITWSQDLQVARLSDTVIVRSTDYKIYRSRDRKIGRYQDTSSCQEIRLPFIGW